MMIIDSNLNLKDSHSIIQEAGRPVHINILTRNAVRAWLKSRTEERHYAPGDQYRPDETLLFEGQRVTVESVQEGSNPLQGSFTILTLRLPDGARRLIAAEIPDAPVNEQRLVTEERVEEVLREQQAEIRQALRSALSNDPRLVSSETSQGEFWCLEEMLPEVTAGELQEALDFLPNELEGKEIVSHTIEGLARAVWGLEDDGSDDYALYTFALRRALDACDDVINLGDRWASAQAWQAFTSRPALTSPKISSDVKIPEGVEMTSPSDVEREQRQEAAEEEEEKEEQARAEERETENLETWREDHPDYAVFTLRARHYHEGWLPLSRSVRALFPPLGSGRQEVVFHHHFGDEPASLRAWVDRERNRIWVSRKMYETFRNHRIYPGARLRVVARNEREFDLTTRETDKTEPIRVWRMWLNEDGEIEYEDFEEPRRYEVVDDVYVADVRFEDREALLAQAEEVGNSVFGLMYKQAVEWWERGDREPLTMTADDLFEAIHFDEQGRMVSRATIAWELWKRLAFKALGAGCYRFRPEFGSETRSATPLQSRETEPSADDVSKAEAYFIFQQRPDSEYADRAGEIYNWRKGIPGSRQIVEGARFIYYRPGEQIFFGTGRVTSIDTYAGQDEETYYNGRIADYEPWDPPLPLTSDLAQQVSFIKPDRLGVGQAGIRKINQADFQTILGAYLQLTASEELDKPRKPSADIWDEIVALAGRELQISGEGAPFHVLDVDDTAVRIKVVSSGHLYTVYRRDLENIWEVLKKRGQLRQTAIRRELGCSHPTYAAAILEALPEVNYKREPIRLFYETPQEVLDHIAKDTGSDQQVGTELDEPITRKQKDAPVSAQVQVPPVELPDPDLSFTEQKALIAQHLKSYGVPLRKHGTIYHIPEKLALVSYVFRGQNEKYWFGPSPNVLDKAREHEVYFMLLILDSAETVLVLPGKIVDVCLANEKPSQGHYHIHISNTATGYILRECDDLDITSYLNAYELILEAAKNEKSQLHKPMENKVTSVESESSGGKLLGRWDAPPVPSGETIKGAEEVEDMDTQDAFEVLSRELQDALVNAQASIEDAVKQSDFSAARDAAERGEEIQEQIDQLKDLKKQWGNIVGSETAAERAKRAPQGASTPQEAYRLPILRTLEEMGGRGRTSNVLDRVGEIMKGQLNKWDCQMLSSGGDIRWRNRAQWARNDMVKDGLLASDSPRGIWEITEKGRQVLREHRER